MRKLRIAECVDDMTVGPVIKRRKLYLIEEISYMQVYVYHITSGIKIPNLFTVEFSSPGYFMASRFKIVKLKPVLNVIIL